MTDSPNNLRGIALMIAAMAGFALEDMCIKKAAAGLPTGQIILMIGGVGALVFGAVSIWQGQGLFSRAARDPAMLARNLGEVIGTYGFVTALALAPLSIVTAVQQAMPLAVTMGAALFLGETVGWRRWLAIIVGFAGVIIIIRPGAEGFDPNVLWVILTVIGLGARDLFTRRIPPSIGTMQVATQGFASVATLGAVMLMISGGGQIPTGVQGAYVLGAICVGILSYWALILSNRLAEISAVTPFRYSRLVFGVGAGMIFFDERPDVTTLFGAALIIGSGLYAFARERRRRALSMGQKTG